MIKDTYLYEGIQHIQEIPGANEFVKMYYNRHFIDNRKFNEFGKSLLETKDIDDVLNVLQKFKY